MLRECAAFYTPGYNCGHGRDEHERETQPGLRVGRAAIAGAASVARRRLAIRSRVVVAMLLLLLAKLATVYVPVLFKRMVDLFTTTQTCLIALPLGLIVGYGVLRIARVAFAELRDAVFAKVAQRAIRTRRAADVPASARAVAALPPRAPDRRPVARDRARHHRHRHAAHFMLFNIVPTLLEIALVCGDAVGVIRRLVRARSRSSRRAATSPTRSCVTEWRLKYPPRR